MDSLAKTIPETSQNSLLQSISVVVYDVATTREMRRLPGPLVAIESSSRLDSLLSLSEAAGRW